METEESLGETEEKKRFRELLYSSLLQQRQENETNRIKIALISIGATIAGVATTIKALEPFSNPLLLLLVLIAVYAPWLYSLYVLFKKLKVDEGVKETTKESVIHTTDDRRSTHEQSYGGRLPGGFQTKPTGSTDRDQEVTPAPAPVSDPQDTDSESTNQGNNQGTETEQKK
jgi:hypothetical protein